MDKALHEQGIPFDMSGINANNLEEIVNHLEDLTVDVDVDERDQKVRCECSANRGVVTGIGVGARRQPCLRCATIPQSVQPPVLFRQRSSPSPSTRPARSRARADSLRRWQLMGRSRRRPRPRPGRPSGSPPCSFLRPMAASVIGLNRIMPLEGGLYIWAHRAFGDLGGFLTAWNIWVYGIAVTATILYAIPTELSYPSDPRQRGSGEPHRVGRHCLHHDRRSHCLAAGSSWASGSTTSAAAPC